MFTLSALKRLALVALTLWVSVAMPSSISAGIVVSDDTSLEASFDQLFGYSTSLLTWRPPLPGLQSIVEWVIPEYPRDLSEGDQKILAAGRVHDVITFSHKYPGLVTRASLYAIAANPLSPESRQILTYFDRNRSYRYLAATKAQMERDPVYAAEIERIMDSPVFRYQPPLCSSVLYGDCIGRFVIFYDLWRIDVGQRDPVTGGCPAQYENCGG